jgi:hypothetical protein
VVTLLPVEVWIPTTPTEIPASDMEVVTRLLTPERYYEGGMNDHITPPIALVEVTHSDQSKSHLYVRWSGKNPALVSLDGRNYFYATNHPDVHDGAVQLVALVRRVAEAKKG